MGDTFEESKPEFPELLFISGISLEKISIEIGSIYNCIWHPGAVYGGELMIFVINQKVLLRKPIGKMLC